MSTQLGSPEPQMPLAADPLTRYLLATRPLFLTVTFVGSLIGLGAVAADDIAISSFSALLSLLFAMVAHAGANVLNDYFDALNGTDATNHNRLFPFTGGSRFIQDGVLTPAQTKTFGYTLLVSVVPPGLWLMAHSASGLFAIGLAGLLIAWAYSATPLQLMSRGLGEIAVVAGWMMVTLGTDYVQRGSFALLPVIAGVPFALLVAAILYLNQFPDVAADTGAGKRTLVVRLGSRYARWGYLAFILAAYLWLGTAVIVKALPMLCVVSLLTAPLSFFAFRIVLKHADDPLRLLPAIKGTIAAANIHGLLMAATLVASRTF